MKNERINISQKKENEIKKLGESKKNINNLNK